MRIASTEGATSMQHDGVDYEADEAGLFEVPEEVGRALIGFPHWQQEWQALDEHLAEKAEQDRDPELLAARVDALEASHAELSEKHAALLEQHETLAAAHAELLAALQAEPESEPETEPEPVAPVKRGPGRPKKAETVNGGE